MTHTHEAFIRTRNTLIFSITCHDGIWMDGSTDQMRRVLLSSSHTDKTGIMRGVVGGLGWGDGGSWTGLHDINLVWGFRGVKHKRQLCC